MSNLRLYAPTGIDAKAKQELLSVVIVAPVSIIVTRISDEAAYLFVPNLSIQTPDIVPNLLNEWAVNITGEPDSSEDMAEIVYVPGGSVPNVSVDDAMPSILVVVMAGQIEYPAAPVGEEETCQLTSTFRQGLLNVSPILITKGSFSVSVQVFA